MQYLQVSVRKNTVNVVEWEIPLLIAMHGEDNVQVLGPGATNAKPKPDAELEYDRLESRYRDADQSNSWVQKVYGPKPMGVERLAEQIEEAEHAEESMPFSSTATREEQKRALEQARIEKLAEKAKQDADLTKDDEIAELRRRLAAAETEKQAATAVSGALLAAAKVAAGKESELAQPILSDAELDALTAPATEIED